MAVDVLAMTHDRTRTEGTLVVSLATLTAIPGCEGCADRCAAKDRSGLGLECPAWL